MYSVEIIIWFALRQVKNFVTIYSWMIHKPMEMRRGQLTPKRTTSDYFNFHTAIPL
jgi:hypothetical protein